MKNWLRRKLRDFLNEEDHPLQTLSLTVRDRDELDSHEHEPIRFSIFSAVGGKVVEIKTYDKKTDRLNTSLHIIQSDENFGDSIAKIIFMEGLKRG